MLEWFKQTNPKYTEHIRRFISTSCSECFIDITGWMNTKHNDWQFVDVSMLSNHDTAWRCSMRGRVKMAWLALRGRLNPDMEFIERAEVDDFITHLTEVADETFGKKV